MGEFEDMRAGWDFMSQVIGADAAGHQAVSDFVENMTQNNSIDLQNLHIKEINDAIDQLAKSINEYSKINLNVEQFKGFVAEEWHAWTFNIDALRKGSEHRAWTLQDNSYASVDVETNFGKEYSLKYSNTAKAAENMQAALNPDTRSPKYHGQERLIANEQVDEAKAWAHRRGLRDIENRPDVSKSHSEVEKHLVGKISDGNGIASKELSVEESKQIAKEAKTDGFDPEKHGFKKEAFLEHIQIDYLNNAIKAGLSAAAITAITQMIPELYKAIDYLIKNGEVDLNEIGRSGEKIISSSGEAFLRGSIAYSVEMAVQNGILGEAIKTVDPSVIGVAVTVVLGTIKDSILVAAGKKTPAEMGANFVDAMIASSGYLIGMKVGGMVVQALCPQMPGIAYAIGSLIGCSVSVAYHIGKKKLISFCVDTGFTCFGLVDQDYSLPDETLKQLGVETVEIPRIQVEMTDVQRTTISRASVVQTKYETVNLNVLRRGIIGVNKVGYVAM